MRALLLALALTVAAQAQADGRTVHRVDRLALALPDAFEPWTNDGNDLGGGVSVYGFTNVATGEYAILTVYRELSWWRRVRHARGWGVRRQHPQFTFRDVEPGALGLSAAFSDVVGTAHLFSDSGTDVGLGLRGCDGPWCFLLSVSGPGDGDPASGLRYADFFADARVLR